MDQTSQGTFEHATCWTTQEVTPKTSPQQPTHQGAPFSAGSYMPQLAEPVGTDARTLVHMRPPSSGIDPLSGCTGPTIHQRLRRLMIKI